MKITDKQKEILIKMRDNKDFVIRGFHVFSLVKLLHCDFQNIQYVHGRLMNSLLAKEFIIESPENSYHYILNPIHQTYINSL